MEIRQNLLKSLVFFVGYLVFVVHGDFTEIVNVCCEEGTNWASNNDRCDDFSGEVLQINPKDRLLCHQVIQVCCIKSKQDQMCTKGMENGLEEGGRCAVRDDVLGAVTYKECCTCCQMGLAVRRMGMPCNPPSIGNPCDMKFMQCCQGIDDDYDDEYDQDSEEENEWDDGLNECEVFGADQLCSQICVDTPGSYRCKCNRGYKLAADERTCYRDDCSKGYAFNTVTGQCEDIDECVIGTHDCNRPNEFCQNGWGSFNCQCDDGFYRNWTTRYCEDIDECARRTDTCTSSQRCVNIAGSFSCRRITPCGTGWTLDEKTQECVDIDECARRIDNCTSSQRCENTAGSFSCRRITPCGTGWTLDEKTQECVDQDECALGTDNCGDSYECYNIEGSFRCNPKRCPEGFRFNSSKKKCERFTCGRGLKPDKSGLCVDINECTEKQNPCRKFQSCQNVYGSYRCIDSVHCGPGFEVDRDGKTCIDIDECREGTHDCRSPSVCINHRGSYICSCPQGYRRGVGGSCEDKNECLYGNVCPSNAVCENTPGSFRCICDPGFEHSGSQRCIDINECNDPSICTQGCNNLIGSYVCTCNAGYKLAADGRTCVDINECGLYNGPGVCAGNCVNTPGSYMCSCPNGWRLMGNGRSCGDIDECQEGTDRCGSDRDVMCFNTRGSHRCPTVTCPSGFSRSDLGPRRNSVRCKRLSFTCRQGDLECLKAPLSLSYNFLSFPTNVKIPTDLFSMSGPYALKKDFYWYLNITNTYSPRGDVKPVRRSDFALRRSKHTNSAVVALLNQIEGPQDVELMLTMQITDSLRGYTGYAISKIYLYVTSDKIQ